MYLYTHTFTDCKYLYRHIYSLTVLYSINYKMRFITLTYTEAEYSPNGFIDWRPRETSNCSVKKLEALEQEIPMMQPPSQAEGLEVP